MQVIMNFHHKNAVMVVNKPLDVSKDGYEEGQE